MSTAKTMFQKIWDLHAVSERGDGEALLYVDCNVVHEGPFYAFDGLLQEGRNVRRPRQTFAFADHYVPTRRPASGMPTAFDAEAGTMIEQLRRNAERTGIAHFGLSHPQQGIMHVVAPEIGLVQPGMLISGSDSHTSTNGAFGAFAFGVGASQIKHVLAMQTVWFRKPKQMRVSAHGALARGVSAKDLALAIIAKIGIGGGAGHIIEYAGNAVVGLSIEGRMTLCNMSIEAGAQAGIVAPDRVTYDYLRGREFSPSGQAWDEAIRFWRTIPTDAHACFDSEVDIDAGAIEPMVTWGTCQDEVVPVSSTIPDPRAFDDRARRGRGEAALAYMGLVPGTPVEDIKIDFVFIGSCTNARLEDLRAAAHVVRGRKASIPAIVVPGSMSVKRAAEAEGLDQIFLSAGLEWRDPGCSMCTGANGDRLLPRQRCASTSNRNFEGRQGVGSRTHLLSPAMAAAAAITGRLADVRDFLQD